MCAFTNDVLVYSGLHHHSLIEKPNAECDEEVFTGHSVPFLLKTF